MLFNNFNLLDLIFPIQIVGNNSKEKSFSFTKTPISIELSCIWVAFNFENDYIAELINRAKHRHEYALCDIICTEFCDKLVWFWSILVSRQEPIAEIETKTIELFQSIFDPSKKVLFTFVPPDSARFLQRGFHLPEILCQKIVQKLNVISNNQKTFCYDQIFTKGKSTQKQTGMSRKNRLQNLNNKIQINQNLIKNLCNYDYIIIIDDICTTGATLNECAKTLKNEYQFLNISGIAVASNT